MYYHYTSLSALRSIVESGAVWMSNLAYMNDPNEGFEFFKTWKNFHNPSENHAKLLHDLVDGFLRWQFCFCATTLRGASEHWRAYSSLTKGVCIEFKKGLFPDEVRRIDCVYDESKKIKRIADDPILGIAHSELEQFLKSEGGSLEYAQAIVDVLPEFKDPSLSSEGETRWVLSLSGLSDPHQRIRFRDHNYGVTSYQAVDVDLSKVISITLGPQVPDQNHRVVEDMLIKYDCGGFVTKSQLSLR